MYATFLTSNRNSLTKRAPRWIVWAGVVVAVLFFVLELFTLD